MNKLYLSVMVGLFSSSAIAADNSWTGFYAGGNLGYASGYSSAKATLGGSWSLKSQAARDFITSKSSNNSNPSGFGFGLQAGYDYQLENRLVLGIEADYTSLKMDESRQTAQLTSPITVTYAFSNKVEANRVFSLRPKLGYAYNNTMIYATAGYAWTSADFSSDLLSSGNYSKVGKSSETLGSAIFGVGVEHKFLNNISARLEYLKVNGGDTNYTTKYRNGNFLSYSESFNVDLDYDVTRVGLNYRF